MEDDDIIDLTVPQPVIPIPKQLAKKQSRSTTMNNSNNQIPKSLPVQTPKPTRTPKKRKASKKTKSDDEDYEEDGEVLEISTPAKQKKVKKVEEKRLLRWKSTPSSGTRDRIYRALNQRMFLISRTQKNPLEAEFVVLGSIGNVYNVNICKLPSCTCPDFDRGYLCKHILFVFLKVLKVPSQSELIYQKALLSTELESIFAKAPTDPSIMASQRVVQKYQELTGQTEAPEETIQRRAVEGDCPVCYEDMTEKQVLVWCQHGCGNNIHQECFQQWSSSKTKQHQEVTCVWCRSAWSVEPAKKGTKSITKEGFINLAKFQPELPRERDTSTYREFSEYYTSRMDYQF